MDEELRQFLYNRGISEETVKKMGEDKLDRYVIKVADDSTLTKYLPHIGDRVAVKEFCKSMTASKGDLFAKETRRNQILNSLRKKLLFRRATHTSEGSDSDGESSLITKVRKGILAGNKNAQKLSRKIEIGWLHFDTSTQMYRQVRKKRGGSTRRVDICKESTIKEVEEVAKSLFFPNGTSPNGSIEDFDFEIRDFSEEKTECQETVCEMYDRTGMNILRFYLASKQKNPQPQYESIKEMKQMPTLAEPVDKPHTEFDKTQGLQMQEKYEAEPLTSIHDDHVGQSLSSFLDDSENEVFFKNTSSPNIAHDINDTLPYIPPLIPAEPLQIDIHRGAFAFQELCNYFKDPSILNRHLIITRILANGEKERAEDTGGVLRDLFTEFWTEFYCKCTVGRDVKVPSLRHDFGMEEWKAIGRLLAYGWQNVGYWPIRLAKTFMTHCLFPDTDATNNELLEEFYQFISLPDRDVFEKGFTDFSSVGLEDLLDALDAHECRTKVSGENFRAVLLEIAHKEMIQMPMYVCDCWRDILKELCISTENLNDVYSTLNPSNRKVVQMLQIPEPLNAQTNEVSKYLKRYVIELDLKALCLFLRFCTGSDLITVPRITVEFVNMTGLSRRPIGHTCGCVLQIGDYYDTFMEFRSEFDSVLESNIWIMDII